MTRGERNHNPLNIRRSRGTIWFGQAQEQHDREFVQFINDLMGYRAAFRIMRTYMTHYGLVTIRGIIKRWAPPEDGNMTSQYVNMVSALTGIKPDTKLSTTDPEQIILVVAAMARVESGIIYPDMDVIRSAYVMAQ